MDGLDVVIGAVSLLCIVFGVVAGLVSIFGVPTKLWVDPTAVRKVWANWRKRK